MDKSKKIGYFFIGLAPFILVLLWQIVVTYLGMFVYAIGQIQVDRSILNDVERLIQGFQMSPVYSVLVFVTYIGYGFFVLWYYLLHVRGKQTGAYKRVLKLKYILLILAGGILLQIGIDMILEILFQKIPKLYESYSAISNALGTETVWMIVSICILAPIGEEVIFRGLTYRWMRQAVPWQAALIIQAVLFGVYHLNPVQGCYAALLGLVLGYLAHRYESVLPGILLHIVINSSSYLVGYILPEGLTDSMLWMTVIGITATGVSLLLVYLVGRGGNEKEA